MNRALRAGQLVELLAGLGHPAALIGGLAVSVRTRERFTRDFDFAVAVEGDAEAEHLCRALQSRGFMLAQVIEQEARGVLAMARFVDPAEPGGEPTVDLLFHSSGIESEIVAAATTVQVAPGIALPVASVPHLIATKVLAETPVRDQDRADLRALLLIATDVELEEARAAIRLIEERGFARGKDLEATLAGFVAEADEI